MNIRKMIASMVGLLGLAAVVAPAHAQYVTLTPGGSVTVHSVTASLGTALASTGPQAWGGVGGDPTGTFTSSVYQGFSGGLIYAYSFTNDISSSVALENLQVANFTGVNTAVAFLYPGSTSTLVAPSDGGGGDVSRSLASTVQFDFGTPNAGTVGAGYGTVTLLISTNSAAYISQPMGGATDTINNGGPHSVYGFTPEGRNLKPNIGNPILAPEPTTVAAFGFIGLGVLGLAFRARRRTGSMTMAA